ncbi:MAG: MepB family protein [Candidatus Neptunochlamydia sp.]|nr:MepB family protein [Candidatus Neptunochlamydia sp.]
MSIPLVCKKSRSFSSSPECQNLEEKISPPIKKKKIEKIDVKSEDFLTRDLPADLVFAIENIYTVAGISINSRPLKEEEKEGEEYKAYRFYIENGDIMKHVAFRVGKVTPSRPGNFVTFWKRPNSVIEPLDVSDGIDFAVVHVSNGERRGQFIFDKTTLFTQRIFSDTKNSRKGKLAFRVFPPWSQPAKSALKTQSWQLKKFFEIPNSKTLDYARVLRLFKMR